jgi:hypothetical protein
MEHKTALRVIERLGASVLPHFHRKYGRDATRP